VGKFAPMQERVLKKNQDIEIRIVDLAFGGVGIGKIPTGKGDFTVFVQNTIPGQLVSARVEKAQKRYAECRLMDVLELSPDEVKTSFQPIPGAPYASWPIDKQTASKKKTVLDLFRKIGMVHEIEDYFEEYILSPSIWHYRNKMEYSFSVIRFDLQEKRNTMILDSDSNIVVHGGALKISIVIRDCLTRNLKIKWQRFDAGA
jgi:tRNA/tmRNA/rRNA uracil-C5-methylase (TrmA/RlmC/RlmD family)